MEHVSPADRAGGTHLIRSRRTQGGLHEEFAWVEENEVLFPEDRQTDRRGESVVIQTGDGVAQFAELLAEVTADFVNVSVSCIDDQIGAALAHIGTALGLDRIDFTEQNGDSGEVQITHSWTAAGVEMLPGGITSGHFPWIASQLSSLTAVEFSSPNDFPRSAGKDRESARRLCLLSGLVIPFGDERGLACAIAFSSNRRGRLWSGELKRWLRLLGQVVYSASLRKRSEAELRERLEFELMLGELSAGFVNLRAPEVDATIDTGLSRIAEHLDIERAALAEFSADGAALRHSHSYSAPGAPELPPMWLHERFPWYTRTLREGTPIAMSQLPYDLPECTEGERELVAQEGMKSHLAVPLTVGGTVLGVISLAAFQRERPWPKDLIRRLHLIGEVFANALVRKHAEEVLRERLEFELMLGELSAGFVNLRSHEVDAAINTALRRIAEHLYIERASLAEFSAGGAALRHSHSYSTPGAPDLPPMWLHERLPWYTRTLREGTTLAFSNLPDDMPEGTEGECELVAEEGMKSHLAIPLVVGGAAVGVIGLAAFRRQRAWPEDLIRRLRLIGEVFANALVRKRAEEERTRLVTAVDQADEAIVIAVPDGAILYANPAFETITGYSREEADGRDMLFPHADVVTPETLEPIRETLARGESWAGHLAGRTKGGQPFEAAGTISPIRDESGTIANHVTVFRDVTEQLRLERQFRQTQKLESLGTLAGGIAHDFNNVLTPIIGFAQLMMDEIDGPITEEQQHDLERIVAAGVRAQDLIGQILAFSRDAEQNLRPVRLAPLIKETLKLMKASLPTTVEIRQRIDSEQDAILGDPTRIHQVLVNLCTNAGAAVGEAPGVLEVALTDFAVEAEFVARNPDMKEGPYVRLTVTDTGCGMTQEVAGRIFEPFFTTRGGEGGTGLGLAAVHGIVKSFGGAIRVYSEPGQGTTFHIYLPCAESAGAIEDAEERPVPTGTESILFVDDEEAIAELGRKMLEGLGYRVETAADGFEALELFRADPEGFDLVVTDQTMPRMTGQSLLTGLHQLRPDLPGILSTGFARLLSDETVGTPHEGELVHRPLTKRQLGEAVRLALDRSAKHAEGGGPS